MLGKIGGFPRVFPSGYRKQTGGPHDALDNEKRIGQNTYLLSIVLGLYLILPARPKTPFFPETGLRGQKPIENRESNGTEGHHEPRFPEESRLYTGPIFRPLLDTKTRIGSQGYVLSDGMVSSSFFSYGTCIFHGFWQDFGSDLPWELECPCGVHRGGVESRSWRATRPGDE